MYLCPKRADSVGGREHHQVLSYRTIVNDTVGLKMKVASFLTGIGHLEGTIFHVPSMDQKSRQEPCLYRCTVKNIFRET